MTNIFDVYTFINFICDKDRRGYLSPDQVSQVLEAAQTNLFHYYWGLPATSTGTKGGAPNPDYGSSQLTIDALRPFRKRQTITNTGVTVNGVITIGTTIPDYAYFIGLNILDGTTGLENNVDQYLNSEVVDALKSTLYPVTPDAPIFSFDGNYIQLYPRTQLATGKTLEIHYLCQPTTPVIGYTIPPNSNAIVYNPATSTQLLFSKEYWMEIIARALSYIGVNLSAEEVSGLAKEQFATT